MSANPRILNNALLPTGTLAAVHLDGERISALSEPVHAPASDDAVDLGGDLLLPGLVEGHIHLDKCFIGDDWHPYRPGNSIADRIRIEREELATAKPVIERARALVEHAIARGTTVIRTHVDIDPDVGLSHFDAMLQVRAEYRDAVLIQIVAFPQHGVIVKPGTLELMAEAIDQGADIVGGLDPATFDNDIPGHLDAIFALAERTGAPLDIHLHDGGDLGAYEIAQIAERTAALGMQGRVAISHAYALGFISESSFAKLAPKIAEAGVSIMTNAPGDHAFPPVLALREAGVNVFAGSDNVRDTWWPYGDADMLNRAMMIGYRSGFYTDAELEVAFDLVTAAGSRALGIEPGRIEVGAAANLIALPARHVPEAVVAAPVRSLVLYNGRVVARNGRFQSLS